MHLKIKFVVDSSCGLTEKEAKEKGWGFLPMLLNIDEKCYKDGVDINPNEYYSKINFGKNVKTSATPIGLFLEKIKNYSKNNDYVVIYSLSEKLSSQNSNIKLWSKEFKNVFVVPSKSVGFSITRDLEDLENNISDFSWEEIKEKITNMTNKTFGLVLVKDLSWLVKGGRTSPSIAKMANLLKIVPIISLEEGELKKYSKSRVFDKAFIKYFIKLFENNKEKEFIIYNASNEIPNKIISKIKQKSKLKKITIKQFPPIIANHLGPGALGVIMREKL